VARGQVPRLTDDTASKATRPRGRTSALIRRPEGIPLTGERTAPGIGHENYWYRRHEAAYRWIAGTQPVAGAVVLDAGCGEGYGGELLAGAGAALVLGLDLDLPTLRHAAAAHPAVPAVVANLVALPLADGSADVVVSSQVVEHLWDQDLFVRECARTLRPGGRLVVTTPNRLTFPPGNVFHSRELDAGELASLVGRHLAVHQVAGLRHGPRLVADDARAVGIVEAQVAIAPEVRDVELTARVAAVTAADFVVDDHGVDGCLDLVLTAVRR
jgi:2-polyprenyl-3-methyl-5-hydroxy-6-metoxy-1,4-benzoquinol methylase